VESQHIANFRKVQLSAHKHNLTMVSNALPGTVNPKMNDSFIHMACASSYCSCAQDGYLKCPHLTIIDGDMLLDKGWFLLVLELADIPHAISQAKAR
jgi:hypothetical protein